MSDRVILKTAAVLGAAGRPTEDPATAKKPNHPLMLLFGDSHSHAVQRAIEKRRGKGQPLPLTAHRLLKMKEGKQLGDTSFENLIERIRLLRPDDVLFSVIGGNQHAVFSMIQHPQSFDFHEPGRDSPTDEASEIIPYRLLASYFERAIRNRDGKSLEALRGATAARVVHVIPPPPKADTAFIEQNHETLFANQGIASRGVSSPALRLKFWRLQTRVLEQICKELEIEIMLPPAVAVDGDGFLKREYYADDATHANHFYGEKLLREIERLYCSPASLDQSAA